MNSFWLSFPYIFKIFHTHDQIKFPTFVNPFTNLWIWNSTWLIFENKNTGKRKRGSFFLFFISVGFYCEMGSTTVKVSNLKVPIIRGESRVPFLLLTSSSAYSFTHFALFACWKVCHSSSPVFVPSFLALLTIIQSFFFFLFYKIIELLIFYFSIHLNLMMLICG